MSLTKTKKEYETTIGLEIHVELFTNSKMFCGCKVEFGGEENVRVCPVCLGMPGSLPVANKKAIEYTIKTGLALDCKIASFTQFHRKNYFYPDMPKDYQISQFERPFCSDGHLDVEVEGGQSRVRINRVHLEEDTGKMLHQSKSGRIVDATYSLVDFNRAGTPLMEIVTEPDIKSPEEARVFMQKLRQLVLSLGVSDCNMEEGSMRCDANVSLKVKGEKELGVKAEVKNMNSFRALQKALAYEIRRQEKVLDEGDKVIQETRHWDAVKNLTSSLRSKEEAHDYRYFTDPDLVPMDISDDWIEEIRETLPELPEARKERFKDEYKLSDYDAGLLSATKVMGDYFEAAIKSFNNSKTVANWIMGELSMHLNSDGKEIEDSPISPESLAGLLELIDKGSVSGKMAKEIFLEMYETGKDAPSIVKEKGVQQISDESSLTAIIEEVIGENPSSVEDFKAGKQQVLGYLVGQVMKATKGQANPQAVNKLLREALAKH